MCYRRSLDRPPGTDPTAVTTLHRQASRADIRPPLLAAPLTAVEPEGPNVLGSTGASFDTTSAEKKDHTSVQEYGAQAHDGEQPTEVSCPRARCPI